MVKVKDPTDIQDAYSDLGNPAANPDAHDDLSDLEQRASAPNTAADYAAQDQRDAAVRDSQTDDLGDAARSGEQTNGGWANNTTARSERRDTRRKLMTEIKTFFQHRGAIVGIIALLGGGAAVPFLGAASLPFSILGNMDARSMLQGLTKYNDDYLGFKYFGKSSSVSPSGDKIKGLTADEIKQLKANGVEFKGGTVNKVTGKTTFTHVKMQGGSWVSAADFSKEMSANPAFRKAMRYTRSGYFKSLKSIASANVRSSKYKINTNPDIEGEDAKAREKKLFKNTVAAATADAVKLGPGSSDNKPDNVSAEDAAARQSGAQGIIDGITDEANTQRQALEDATEFTSDTGRTADMSNIATQMEREAIDVEGTVKGIGGKIWGFVNALDIADMVCTTYQIAQTAVVVTRTVALAHYVSYAMQLRAVIERTKAGDDTKGDTNFIMNLLNKRDPVTGLAFDSTSYAAFLFNGTVSDQPDSLSVFGGQAMIALNMGLGAIHTFAGGGNPFEGRKLLKGGCAIATNLGVQIAATIGGFFTGGLANAATKVGSKGLMEVIKKGLSSLRETIVKNFGKEAIKKIGEDITEKGAIKYFASRAWKGFSNTWKSLDALGKVGIVFAAVSTFGLAYVIDVLSGTDVAALLTSGPMSMQALGTGWETFGMTTALAAGGAIAGFALYNKYRSQMQDEQASYIADMKQEASDRPFDITTPYSQLGAALFGAQNLIGISASTNILATIKSVATLPLRLPSLGATTHAASQPTAEEIAQKAGDEYAVDMGVARTITGTPYVLFEKSITFAQFLAQFVDSSNAQVTFDGTDETTSEPKFTIKPDSELAKWKEECRNPNRIEPDETLASDETYYDMEKCTTNRNAAFDDAIRYINQTSPDQRGADNTAAGPTGTCPTPGSTRVEGIAKGWEKDTGEEVNITLCAITGTSAQINPTWKDEKYQGSASKNISEIVVNSKAAAGLIKANEEYKKKYGQGLSASVGYRSVYEQCSFFVGGKNSYSDRQEKYYNQYCKPNLSWLKSPVGNWNTNVIVSNHMMGYSIDFTRQSESWMRQCMQGDTDGKKDNRCFGFWDDVNQSGNGDTPHFTFDASKGASDL